MVWIQPKSPYQELKAPTNSGLLVDAISFEMVTYQLHGHVAGWLRCFASKSGTGLANSFSLVPNLKMLRFLGIKKNPFQWAKWIWYLQCYLRKGQRFVLCQRMTMYLQAKKARLGAGAWGWRGRLHQPSSCKEGHKGRGRHPEVFNSTPVIPIVAG